MTIIEKEYFKDNETAISYESAKLERSNLTTEEAAHFLEEKMDALKAAAESCGSAEVNVDYIINNVIQGGKQSEIVNKIVHYKTKEAAINDCILDLRSNSKLPIEQNMMLIRQLSSK